MATPFETKLKQKPFQELMADLNKATAASPAISRGVTPKMEKYAELVAYGIYNRVWSDIREQWNKIAKNSLLLSLEV